MVSGSSVLRFAEFEVRPEALELRRAGSPVHLEPKVLQVLIYLIEQRHRVVGKAELLEVVWDESFVTENALTKAIARLRQALDDHPQDPRFIQTAHTVGYRFIADLESPAPEPADHRRLGLRAVLLSVGVLVVLLAGWLSMRESPESAPVDVSASAQVRSLAVLPLVNLTGDSGQDYLVDAIHDALIGELAGLGPLRVISRQSTLLYRDSEKTAPEIADELSVDALIEGTVLRSGDRVRVSAQMILGREDLHLWAESFEGGAGDVLVLVSDLARAVADEVQLRLTSEQQSLLASRRSVDPRAEDAYLQGRYSVSLGTAEAMARALGQFVRAVELDPEFARAHAGLAGTHFVQALFGRVSHLEAGPACKESALAALALDPDLAEARGILGLAYLYFDWDWSAAERELVRALELQPNNSGVRHGYGDYLLVMGRPEESLEQVRLSRLYDPASPLAIVPVVGHLLFLHRYDEVIQESRAILDADPEMPLVGGFLATALWAKGQRLESLDLIRQHRQGDPALIAALDRGLEQAGPQGAMLAVAEFLAAHRSNRQLGSVFIARYFALGGDADRAFDLLIEGVAERDPQLLHLQYLPEFDGLQSHPRFREIEQRIGLPARAEPRVSSSARP